MMDLRKRLMTALSAFLNYFVLISTVFHQPSPYIPAVVLLTDDRDQRLQLSPAFFLVKAHWKLAKATKSINSGAFGTRRQWEIVIPLLHLYFVIGEKEHGNRWPATIPTTPARLKGKSANLIQYNNKWSPNGPLPVHSVRLKI